MSPQTRSYGGWRILPRHGLHWGKSTAGCMLSDMPRVAFIHEPTTLLAACAVAVVGCATAPPPPVGTDPQFAQVRAAQAKLDARVAALEERMRQADAHESGPAPVIAQPELPVTEPTQVAEHHYRVPRKYFDEMLQDPDRIMREVRVVPVQERGRVTGLKLFGLRPNTRLGVLGFQNGDQLHTLNELPLTTPEQALEAYAAVRNASSLRVQLLRRGQRIELRYDLVD